MRLHYNNLIASLGGSLTNAGTTITFGAALTYNNGVNVPTIANGDILPLVIDPRLATFEVVYLTAYTSGATTGTISRGQDGTTASAHSVSAAVLNAPVTVEELRGRVFQIVSLFLSVASGTGAGTTSLSITAPVANNAQGATVAKSGDTCTLWDPATGVSQTVTLNADVHVGDTTITTTSFTPSENFPIGAELIPKSWTWPIPAGLNTILVTANGAGGSGGGGGTATNTTTEPGGGGGGAGGNTTQLVNVGANTSLTLGIGVPGAGVAGGAAAGHNGTIGNNGGNTTITATGISVTAYGGVGGSGSTATSTNQSTGGCPGANIGGTGVRTSVSVPGGGGSSLSNANGGIGVPFAGLGAGTGGSAGGAASSTNGGGGGTVGLIATPVLGGSVGSQAGTSGGNATSTGALGNTACGGGGGGGGNNNTGTGGNSTPGTSGNIFLSPIG